MSATVNWAVVWDFYATAGSPWVLAAIAAGLYLSRRQLCRAAVLASAPPRAVWFAWRFTRQVRRQGGMRFAGVAR